LDLESTQAYFLQLYAENDICAAIKELRASGNFIDMNIQTDEDEHSIEMHLPYVRKVFDGYGIFIYVMASELTVAKQS
jgi:predicted class III extradiol MEMO1 family dioxygenase